MKLIIAGSRHIGIKHDELFEILDELKLLYEIKEIVSGGATGVDSGGEEFGKRYKVPVKRFPANWAKYGGLAGPRRNREMAEYANALLLIWDGQSRGSANMKARMKGMGKPVFEIIRPGKP